MYVKLGYTCLHQAAQQGQLAVINLLLKYEASPNAVTHVSSPTTLLFTPMYFKYWEQYSMYQSRWYSGWAFIVTFPFSFFLKCNVIVRFLEPCCPAHASCLILLGLSDVSKYFK